MLKCLALLDVGIRMYNIENAQDLCSVVGFILPHSHAIIRMIHKIVIIQIVPLIDRFIIQNYKVMLPLQIKIFLLLHPNYENIDNEKVVGKYVLNCQIFNQDTFRRYLKITMLFFSQKQPKQLI